LSGRYPYGKKHKYTHMIGEDVILWERFIDFHPNYFDTVDYDFRVGIGMNLKTQWDEKFKRMATMITQKRIDVLGWVRDQPTIVEIKKRVGLSTLGQILGYKILFKKDFPMIATPSLLVITESIDPDNVEVMKASNVPVMVV